MQDVPVHIDASIQESPIEGAITIGRLMAEADAFRIPSYYQRDLSWSTAQAEDLWYDLTRALADREAAGGKWSAELLGQVVLTTVASEKASSTEYDVIDGQQRLVTLTILLCCLRDRLEDALLRDRIHSLVKSPNGGRVSPRAETVAFLWTLVQLPNATLLSPGTDGTELARDQRNILDIRQWFVDALSPDRISESQRVALAKLILDHCYVARLIVRDRRKAPDIFIRINTRGKTLLRTDRLKAHLVAKAAAAEQMTLAARWDAAKELVGDDFDGEAENRKYLTSYLHDIYNGARNIEDSIRRLIDERGPENFLSTILEPMAQAYKAVLTKDYPDGAGHKGEIRAYLRYLSWLPRRHWIAPTLVWLVANRDTPLRVVDFLKAMDRYAYGLLILGETGAADEKRFATVLKGLRGAATDGAPEKILVLPKDDVDSILKRVQFSIGNANLRVAKLVLLRIHVREERKARRKGVLNAAEEILEEDNTVEHVLPENPAPGSDWPNLFGPEMAIHDKMIGNLFIVPEGFNKQLGNKSWKVKKPLFEAHTQKDGLLVPAAELLPYKWGKWNRKSLAKRQAALVATIDDIWGFGP